MKGMSHDLRYERSRYVLSQMARIGGLLDRLQSAPLELRRLGLPLAIATWKRDKYPELVRLIGGWLYDGDGWGVLPRRPVPRDAHELLRALEDDKVTPTALRSAVEREVEELLQAAKVLVEAHAGPAGGGGGR